MATSTHGDRPDDDIIDFLPDDAATALAPVPGWRILAVDDDRSFQSTTALAMKNMEILGRPIELVQAYSLAEAAHCLARERDFAVILADVVMETEDAGLRLVKGVRETLGLFEPRIVLLTGQPGFAPIGRVMDEYDLSDYCLKSDLARRGLKQMLTGTIRAYKQLRDLAAARKGLQLIIESSSRLASARSIEELARGALIEVARLLEVAPEGIVCVEAPPEFSDPPPAASGHHVPVIARAEGRFAPAVGQPLEALPDAEVRSLIQQSLAGRISIARSDCQVVFLPREEARADYALFLETGRHLERGELDLLRVFATNLSRGFGNVSLISRLDRLAFEDSTLRMPNATALAREIERLRLKARGAGHQLLLFDLDHFSRLADSLGAAFGNELLRAVADRLAATFPPPALVARLSEDQFGVVGRDDVVGIEAARHILDAPIAAHGSDHHLTACAVQIPVDTEHADAIALQRAGARLLRVAKRRGTGQCLRWDPAFEAEDGQRFRIHADLATALSDNQFRLLFQPQVELDSGRIVGAEALLRWHAPGGTVPPDRFIPVAEKSSHIHSIGRFVIEQACVAIRQLDAAGLDGQVISVNVSARQFDSATLLAEIDQICASHGVPKSRLGLELTETAAMTAFDTVIDVLRIHRDAGGKVAIDDFGTGMASLGYLHTLPVDFLKIDRSFVSRLEVDARSRGIARTIIELGRTLGVSLIAEGVETQAQADWLRQHGCQYAQGWLFGRPLELGQFKALVQQQRDGVPTGTA